jgi:3-deoxy-7-phosphoheptulonate synthase
VKAVIIHKGTAMHAIENTRVSEFIQLLSPSQFKAKIPAQESILERISSWREELRRLLSGQDQRLLVIVGPCSIHDVKAGMEYAQKLASLRHEVQDKIAIVMRVYFEKPRTTIGWKGLINDPQLDGSHDIRNGLQIAREFLLNVASLDLPAGTEFLDPIVPQYIADLISWVAIGARTTESQTHREMASGLSMPVGFKNATDGGLQVALDAMTSARHPHHFLGIDNSGMTAVVKTKGNLDAHVILRGGNQGPNYSEEHINDCLNRIKANSQQRMLLVDCSHGNSSKDYKRQPEVFHEVFRQFHAGNRRILGVMLESHLTEGKQDLAQKPLVYGQSITDGCIAWESTAELIRNAYRQL